MSTNGGKICRPSNAKSIKGTVQGKMVEGRRGVTTISEDGFRHKATV